MENCAFRTCAARAGAVGLLAALGLTTGCAGARYDFAADHARYPISFSPALPDEKGTILYLGHELESKGTFEFQMVQFGFIYGLTGGTLDVSDRVNAEVAARHGQGVVALSVRNDNCFTNYLFPLQILPFYPGCEIVTVDGTVVSDKRQSAPPAAPVARADVPAGAP
jgi:hypothetical protein